MIVKLPRTCTGQEVLDAFLTAGRFQAAEDERFDFRLAEQVYQFEPGSARPVLRSTGAEILNATRRKRHVFFGPYEWYLSGRKKFFLHPVELIKSYDEVEVDVEY